MRRVLGALVAIAGLAAFAFTSLCGEVDAKLWVAPVGHPHPAV